MRETLATVDSSARRGSASGQRHAFKHGRRCRRACDQRTPHTQLRHAHGRSRHRTVDGSGSSSRRRGCRGLLLLHCRHRTSNVVLCFGERVCGVARACAAAAATAVSLWTSSSWFYTLCAAAMTDTVWQDREIRFDIPLAYVVSCCRRRPQPARGAAPAPCLHARNL